MIKNFGHIINHNHILASLQNIISSKVQNNSLLTISNNLSMAFYDLINVFTLTKSRYNSILNHTGARVIFFSYSDIILSSMSYCTINNLWNDYRPQVNFQIRFVLVLPSFIKTIYLILNIYNNIKFTIQLMSET